VSPVSAAIRFPVLALLAGCLAPAGLRAQVRTPAAGVVQVTARDFTFEMPDTVAGGVRTLQLRNAGNEPHHLMLFRLDRGRGLAEVSAALARDAALPSWMHAAGGPNAVVGQRQSIVTLRLQPGIYVAYCFIPSPDHRLHYAKGMMKLVAVVPPARPGAPLPRGDDTVTLSDYGFRLAHALTAGQHRITVTNTAGQAHELILSRLLAGNGSLDFVRWIERQDGPPPVEPFGGVTDIAPGETVVIDVALEPGRYSLLCRVRDAGDGKPHDRHGMMADIIVGPRRDP
jgi:hypothetical protein